MTIEKAKHEANVVKELSESGKDLVLAERSSACEVANANKLWFEGNKSKLVKIGVSFIAFPDPTPVTPIVGASFIAAGLVRKEIQKRSLYVGDVKKIFEGTLRDVQLTKQSLRL